LGYLINDFKKRGQIRKESVGSLNMLIQGQTHSAWREDENSRQANRDNAPSTTGTIIKSAGLGTGIWAMLKGYLMDNPRT
jgi:hypothetical protein